MSILNEINRLNTSKISIAQAIRAKGVDVPEDAKIDTFASYIAMIGASTSVSFTFSGNPVVATETIYNQPFAGFKIFGKTTRDETDGLVSAGQYGSVSILVTGAQLLPDQDVTDYYISADGKTSGKSNGNYSKLVKVVKGYTYFVRRSEIGSRFRIGTVIELPSETTVSVVDKAVDYTQIEQKITATINGYLIITLESSSAFDNLMVSFGNYQNYQPYTAQSFIISTPYSLFGVPVSNGGNCTDADGHSYISDYFDFESGLQNIYCGKIDNYNGEEITTPYISSTGSLDNGAKVIYVLPKPQTQPIPHELMVRYGNLISYDNVTVISSIDPIAKMEAKLYCDIATTIDRKVNEGIAAAVKLSGGSL